MGFNILKYIKSNFPAGIDGQVLSTNSSNEFGLQWIDNYNLNYKGIIDSTILDTQRSSGLYRVDYAGSHQEALLDISGIGGSTPRFQLKFNYDGTFKVRVARDSETIFDTFPWRTVWHDGNFNPSNYLTTTNAASTYLPLTGGTIAANCNLTFANTLAQRINLWSTDYGIGIQGSTFYIRTGSRFSVHTGGSHSNDENNAGTGGVNLLTATTSEFKYIGKNVYHSGNFGSSLAFCLMQPTTDSETARFTLKKNVTAYEVIATCKTAPTASTTLIVYQNTTAIATFSITTTSTTYDMTDANLSAGDVLYAKISGSSNSIDILTIQLNMVDR